MSHTPPVDSNGAANLPDEIYLEWIDEVTKLKLKGDMSAVTVVGELTRALKRVTNRHGGTAYIENGVHYDINNNEIPPERPTNE